MANQPTHVEVHSTRQEPTLTLPYVAAGIIVLIIIAAVAISMMNSEFAPTDPSMNNGDSSEAASIAVEPDVASEITEADGRRAFAVLQDGEWTNPPYSLEATGVLTEVTDAAISVDVDSESYEWPLASDAQVWRDGEPSNVAALQEGDLVSVYLQQLGSREDGWMNSVVKVDAAPGQAASPDGDLDRVFVGAVVEVDDRTITIRNRFSDDAGYAVELGTPVTDGDNVGDLSLIEPGDIVKLFGVRRGNRSDGYTTIINRIEVHQPAAEE